jgi:hypothetical protein
MSRPQVIIEADEKETGPRFMGLPDRWYDNPTWRCENGHVSKRYLKSEKYNGNVCLACFSSVWLTFPEDKENV